MEKSQYSLYPSNRNHVISQLGKDLLIEQLKKMLTIRNLEIRAESAYQHGKIGGFFHSYMGQEAVQVAAVLALGQENWYITSYRCHALALLLGATEEEIMAELYGKATGNAKGRGGSMHLYAKRLLGGFGIVGGQVPIAIGAAFQIKYNDVKDEVAICFLGDGAVAQGAFHESLNLASLWNLPCIFVIENNLWGMGTAVERALCFDKIAETLGPAYNMTAYTFDGMDFFNCYAGFSHVYQEVLKKKRPVIVEVLTERFRGHSISDPGLYRTKESLQKSMQRDPILIMQNILEEHHLIDSEIFKHIDKECRERAIAAMKFAEESPWPDPMTIEEDVFAP